MKAADSAMYMPKWQKSYCAFSKRPYARSRKHVATGRQASVPSCPVSATAQTEPGDRRRTGVMDSYSIASAYGNRRHDLFNRNLAGDLWRRDTSAAAAMACSIADEIGNELPCNWMHRDLARVRRQST
jgi:hypothetical protein